MTFKRTDKNTLADFVIKLALLIPPLDRSGAEKQFSLLATGLPRDEFDVQAITLTRGGPYQQLLDDSGIPVTHINKRAKFDPFALRRLKHVLRKMRPDILHTWLFAANAYGRLVAANRPGPAVVVSERCVDSWKSGWQLWLDRKLVPRTTRLVGNSQAVADFYGQLGYAPDQLCVIPNGITPPDVQFDRADILRELDLPEDAKVVGYVGRLAAQKRVSDLVWAMQLLRQCAEKVYFVIVGDGPEKERTMEHARAYDCQHLIRWTGHRDDSLRLMSAMNVFWLASEFEGMSNSLMEAMALGIPAVVSDIPPNRELVVDGETGFITAVGDSLGFSQYADRILADEQLAARLSAAAIARMQSSFSVDGMVQQYAELYRAVHSTGTH